jgi:hypothetical protein
VEDFGIRTTSRKKEKKRRTPNPFQNCKLPPPPALPTPNPKQALSTHNSVPTPRLKPTDVKAPGPSRNKKKTHLTSSQNRKELPTPYPVQTSEPMPTQENLATLNQKCK